MIAPRGAAPRGAALFRVFCKRGGGGGNCFIWVHGLGGPLTHTSRYVPDNVGASPNAKTGSIGYSVFLVSCRGVEIIRGEEFAKIEDRELGCQPHAKNRGVEND